MKEMRMQFKRLILALLITMISVASVSAQCSICTKTASQLGEKPARGFNSGIVYLMLTPFAVGGFIGYKWWQREKSVSKDA